MREEREERGERGERRDRRVPGVFSRRCVLELPLSRTFATIPHLRSPMTLTLITNRVTSIHTKPFLRSNSLTTPGTQPTLNKPKQHTGRSAAEWAPCVVAWPSGLSVSPLRQELPAGSASYILILRASLVPGDLHLQLIGKATW